MNKFLKVDWIIMICSLSLLSIGLFTLYSLTITSLGTRTDFFKSEFRNQLIFALVGIIFAILVFYISSIYFKLKFTIVVLYIFTILTLIFTLAFGLDIRGVKRWITIGGNVLPDGTVYGGITIQPSEFAKLSVIIFSALFLSLNQNISDIKDKKYIKFLLKYKNILIAALGNFLIIFLILQQKSLTVTLVTLAIIFIIFFASQKNKISIILTILTFFISVIFSQSIFFEISIFSRIILFLIVAVIYISTFFIEKLNYLAVLIAAIVGIFTGAVLLNVVWNNVLRPFQRERIETFLNPNPNALEEDFQQIQSVLSTGAGQLFGHGFRQVGDARLLLLPEPTTDFIFAIFAFKFGFIGSLIVIGLFVILIARLIYLSDQMNDKFSSLVLIGIASMIMIQFFINIGMNLQLLPVGGTTLPFISAGGSSLISMIMGIGIAQNIIASNKMEKNIYRRTDNIMINGWNV